MTQDEVISAARESGMVYRAFEDEFANANTDGIDLQTMEAFVKLVEARKCKELAAKIEQMPFGDTAASFAQWIREQA